MVGQQVVLDKQPSSFHYSGLTGIRNGADLSSDDYTEEIGSEKTCSLVVYQNQFYLGKSINQNDLANLINPNIQIFEEED